MILGLLVIGALAGSPTEASSVAVFRGISIGTEANTVLAVEHLFRGALEGEGVRVVGPDELAPKIGPERAVCSQPECAGSGAARLGVAEALLLSLTRLGSKVVLDARVVPAGSSTVAFSASLPSESDDDLDVVTRRLARAVLRREPIPEGATVDTVTAAESLSPQRRGLQTQFGLRLGGGGGVAGEFQGTGIYSAEAVILQEVGPRVVLEVTPLTGFSWGTKTRKNVPAPSGPYGSGSFISGWVDENLVVWKILGLGGLYFFSDADSAPFVGGGVALAETAVSGGGPHASGTGLAGALRAGIAVLRTYRAHALFEVRYDHTFDAGAPAVGVLGADATITFN